MALNKIFLSVVFLLVVSKCFSQPTYFNKTYYLSLQDSLERGENINGGLIEEPDSTYLAYFFSVNFFTSNTKTVYNKIDKYGNIIAQNILADTGYVFSLCRLINSFDSNFYACGVFCAQVPYDSSFAAIQKIDGSGNLLWQAIQTQPIKRHTCLKSIIKTYNGNLAATGFTYDSTANSQDVYFILSDSNGTKIKDTVIGINSSWESGQSIVQTADSGFLLSGNQYISDYNGYLVKVDKNGVFQWQKTYGNTFRSEAFEKMIALQDGNYLLMGSRAKGPGVFDNFNGWLVKVDENGNIIWNRDYEYGFSMFDQDFPNAVEMDDSSIVISGSTYDTLNSKNDYDAWIVKVNYIGDTVWTRHYDHSISPTHPTDEWLFEIIRTMDGGILVGGFALDSMTGQNAWLLKLDSVGCDSVNCIGVGIDEISNDENFFTVYPNPATDEFTVKINSATGNNNLTFILYDIYGKVILRKVLNKGEVEYEINISNLNAGIYFATLITSGNLSHTNTKKIIKF